MSNSATQGVKFLYSMQIRIDLVRIVTSFLNAKSLFLLFRPHTSFGMPRGCFSTDYERGPIDVEHKNVKTPAQIALAINRHRDTVKRYLKYPKTTKNASPPRETQIFLCMRPVCSSVSSQK